MDSRHGPRRSSCAAGAALPSRDNPRHERTTMSIIEQQGGPSRYLGPGHWHDAPGHCACRQAGAAGSLSRPCRDDLLPPAPGRILFEPEHERRRQRQAGRAGDAVQPQLPAATGARAGAVGRICRRPAGPERQPAVGAVRPNETGRFQLNTATRLPGTTICSRRPGPGTTRSSRSAA